MYIKSERKFTSYSKKLLACFVSRFLEISITFESFFDISQSWILSENFTTLCCLVLINRYRLNSYSESKSWISCIQFTYFTIVSWENHTWIRPFLSFIYKFTILQSKNANWVLEKVQPTLLLFMFNVKI